MDPTDDPPDPDLPAEPVEVPWNAVSPDALRGVIEAFVLREGTDYGLREFTHEEKVVQVMNALQRGEIRMFFEPDTQTVTLLPR
jgi:uncharacterized protein